MSVYTSDQTWVSHVWCDSGRARTSRDRRPRCRLHRERRRARDTLRGDFVCHASIRSAAISSRAGSCRGRYLADGANDVRGRVAAYVGIGPCSQPLVLLEDLVRRLCREQDDGHVAQTRIALHLAAHEKAVVPSRTLDVDHDRTRCHLNQSRSPIARGYHCIPAGAASTSENTCTASGSRSPWVGMAAVPPPRFHLTRFCGVLAAHSALHSLVVPDDTPELTTGAEAQVLLPLFGARVFVRTHAAGIGALAVSSQTAARSSRRALQARRRGRSTRARAQDGRRGRAERS